jgi:hypothetical protein
VYVYVVASPAAQPPLINHHHQPSSTKSTRAILALFLGTLVCRDPLETESHYEVLFAEQRLNHRVWKKIKASPLHNTRTLRSISGATALLLRVLY